MNFIKVWDIVNKFIFIIFVLMMVTSGSKQLIYEISKVNITEYSTLNQEISSYFMAMIFIFTILSFGMYLLLKSKKSLSNKIYESICIGIVLSVIFPIVAIALESFTELQWTLFIILIISTITYSIANVWDRFIELRTILLSYIQRNK